MAVPYLVRGTLRSRNYSLQSKLWKKLDYARSLSSSGPVTSKLNELIERGSAQPDTHQFRAAKELDRVYKDLIANDPPPRTKSSSTSDSSSSGSFFGNIFGNDASSNSLNAIIKGKSTTGAYVYGGVGCGKTFLMTLLYDAVDSGSWSNDKQKVHYHKFMLDVHQHMHEVRQREPQADLIAPVVERVLENGRLLCLDEFQVTDVADALILQRLFQGLWDQGCILVATSNRPPRDLYLHGLQRDRFIPFIDMLEEKCGVVNMLDSETDYRMGGTPSSSQPVYFSKMSEFESFFEKLVDGRPVKSTFLVTQGRQVKIPMGCSTKSIARFSFQDLCERALGAADYIVIAKNYSTVFCHSIPKLSIHHVNWLRRFITFVDSMYEAQVKLVLHTDAASIDDIFVVDNKKDYSQDEVFAFDRSRSRLEEMASKEYLSKKWVGGNDTENI